jgi:competence protein ComEC
VVDEARPWYGVAAVWCWRTIVAGYVINAIVSLAVAPLVASHYHMLSPIALLIGPLMVLLTSIALLAGFLFLLFSWLVPLAWLFASITQLALYGCEIVVSIGQSAPGAYFFVADVPSWWLCVFYVGLFGGLTAPIVHRYARWLLPAGVAWLVLGVTLQLWPHRPGELRCTFVAVGHGGCTVIETPNGRVLMYDAGATTGPDVTRRHIAPFLWSRGIRHIDELVLSHGDLDHFNGIPQLADRFSIGRVRSTPTFAERETGGMKEALAALEKRGLAIEVVKRGDRWDVDGVRFEALHPPAVGPTKNENARSLVLLVSHDDWSLLLTGDLEDEGLAQVLAQPPPRIDVMMAPHHGSDRSNNEALARWARPALVVSSQAEPVSPRLSVPMYERMGAKFRGTWPHGAITIRPGAKTDAVTTFRK